MVFVIKIKSAFFIFYLNPCPTSIPLNQMTSVWIPSFFLKPAFDFEPPLELAFQTGRIKKDYLVILFLQFLTTTRPNLMPGFSMSFSIKKHITKRTKSTSVSG